MPKKKETKKRESKPVNKKEPIKKEEVCEIFDVEKNGEEKTIKSCGIENEKISSPEQMKKETKIFKIIIITLMGFVLLFLGVLWLISYLNHFSVGGVIFEIDKTDMVGKTIYKTSLPVTYQDGTTGKIISADYNFYFRTDPRKLSEIPFEGDMILRENMVLNMTEDFNCNGNGIIALANVLNLYKVIGTKVIKDENATCDEIYGRYMFLSIKEGNETSIMDYGLKGTCYNIYVKGCDILPATEKFMLETLIKVNKAINTK